MDTKHYQQHSKKWLIHVSSWTIFVLYFLVAYGILWWVKIPLETIMYDATTSALVITGTSYLIYSSLQYYLPKTRQFWKLLSFAIVFSILSVIVTRFLLFNIFPSLKITYFNFSIPFRFVVNFLVITCIMIINIFWNIQEEYEENKERKEQSERMVRDAELYNLRQQLQPHFLFNSLNSIIALIGSKPQEARNMTFQLSDFLRGTLRKDEKQLIPLRDEMKHLQLYLDIEKVRFGHRLNTSFTFDEHVLDAIVPAMIIQPILENAIKFGLYNVTGDVEITLSVLLEDHVLIIAITNPFETDQFENKKGTGFGLTSIQRRLFLLFGRTDLLLTKAENNIFTSTLYIPQPNKIIDTITSTEQPDTLND